MIDTKVNKTLEPEWMKETVVVVLKKKDLKYLVEDVIERYYDQNNCDPREDGEWYLVLKEALERNE